MNEPNISNKPNEPNESNIVLPSGGTTSPLGPLSPSPPLTELSTDSALFLWFMIALGVGILGNSFRGIFGKDDIPATRQNDILSDFNQNMRLVGKRGMFGDSEVGFKDNDLYKNTSSSSFHLDKKELKENIRAKINDDMAEEAKYCFTASTNLFKELMELDIEPYLEQTN